MSPDPRTPKVVKMVCRYHPDSVKRARRAKLPYEAELRSDSLLLPGEVVVDYLLEDGRIAGTTDLATVDASELAHM